MRSWAFSGWLSHSHRGHRGWSVFLPELMVFSLIHSQWSPHRWIQFNSIPYLKVVAETREKAMAPHSSILVWKIPWAEEPGRLQSMGLRRVRHNWVTSLSLFTFMHWRRQWQPTSVFLPGESQGQGSLVGCCLWVAQSQTQLKRLSSSSSSSRD